MKYFIIFISLFMANYSSGQKLECSDLLETFTTKQKNIKFLECKKGNGQTILEANYKVAGRHSKKIENYFIRKYKMGPLQFTCCGWESQNGLNGYVKHADLIAMNPNYILEISMFANAEKKNKKGETYLEQDRSKIDFYIQVRILEI